MDEYEFLFTRTARIFARVAVKKHKNSRDRLESVCEFLQGKNSLASR